MCIFSCGKKEKNIYISIKLQWHWLLWARNNGIVKKKTAGKEKNVKNLNLIDHCVNIRIDVHLLFRNSHFAFDFKYKFLLPFSLGKKNNQHFQMLSESQREFQFENMFMFVIMIISICFCFLSLPRILLIIYRCFISFLNQKF